MKGWTSKSLTDLSHGNKLEGIQAKKYFDTFLGVAPTQKSQHSDDSLCVSAASCASIIVD
jgi:hypothetical protein